MHLVIKGLTLFPPQTSGFKRQFLNLQDYETGSGKIFLMAERKISTCQPASKDFSSDLLTVLCGMDQIDPGTQAPLDIRDRYGKPENPTNLKCLL